MNTLLATYGQGVLSFEQALPPSLFYQDFNDTNLLVKEAACLVKGEPRTTSGGLFSSSLLSETNKYLSLDRTPLQTVNFEALFEEYLSPFEHRYEEAKTAATELWREYSAMSNRLISCLWIRKNTGRSDTECGVAKAKYDQAHAHANLSYKEWQQERDRNFCVWCFKPVFLDVLVERLQGIAGSIISDIRRVKEGNP